MIKEAVRFPFEILLKYQDYNDLNIIDTKVMDSLMVQRAFLGESPIKGNIAYYGAKEHREGRMAFRQNSLLVDGETIYCDLFREFSNQTLLSCFIYIFTCTDRQKTIEEVGQFTYHLVKNNVMDMAREMIRKNFISKVKEEYQNDNVWCSKYFGPGYYGMELEESKKIAKLLDAEELGISFRGSFMEPMRTSTGILFCFSKKPDAMLDACIYCKASKENCMYCGGRK